MKKFLCGLGIALSLSLAGTAAAQDLKIGVVSPARVSNEAPQAKALRDRLEKERDARHSELARVQQDIKGLEDRLSRDGAIMKDAERQKLERDVLSRKREFRRMQDEARDDLNLRLNDELSKLQRRVTEIIQQMAKDEKFDLILHDGIVFASDKVDITDKVIERLRQEFKPAR